MLQTVEKKVRGRVIFVTLLAATLTQHVAKSEDAGSGAAKQVILVVGSDVGGGYDTLARIVARHLGSLLPGRPNIVVENMPGAGGLAAANYMYNNAARDGSVIGLMQRSILTARLTNPNGVRFNIAKFNWLGDLGSETGVTVAWGKSPFKDIGDVMRKPMIVAGTGPNDDSETTARLLNALIGTRFKIISGYRSTADQSLAMERGETQGMSDWSWSSLKARGPHYLAKVRLLLQIGLTKDPELAQVPLALDFVKTEGNRDAMKLYLVQKEIARPLLAPPSVSPDRVATLRSAITKMAVEPEFLADAERAKIDTRPITGEKLQSIVSFVVDAPPSSEERLRKAIAPVK